MFNPEIENKLQSLAIRPDVTFNINPPEILKDPGLDRVFGVPFLRLLPEKLWLSYHLFKYLSVLGTEPNRTSSWG